MAPPKPAPGSWMHQMTRVMAGMHVLTYRMTSGVLGGRIAGAPVLLLTTQGRKSGLQRTLPLLYLKTEAGYALVASYGGSDRHPAWYLNLEANPTVTIQVGAKRMAARAETLSGERRAELWASLVRLYSDYDVYQSRTEREIPVIEVFPRDDLGR